MTRLFLNGRVMTGTAGVAVHDGWAVASEDGRIAGVGPQAELAARFPAAERIDLAGRLTTPGLIDCHTHLVHAGSRADEFAQRLAGATYQEIAAAGGGILSTVRATRAAAVDELVASALPRLDQMLAAGATTVEVKSGYGLDLDTEAAMLRAARRLAGERPVRIVTTALPLHALPPEAPARAAYVREAAERWLPALTAEGLIDAVDGFLESIAFSTDDIEALFAAARRLGLPVKLHADQLRDGGGAGLAARYGAISADHLEYANESGLRAMAAAGTVGVLLPGAFYFLKETRVPPIAAMRRAGVAIAVATDCNPGSAPLASLPLAMNMAAVLFGLTVAECWAGTTINAARALGLAHEIGSIEAGKYCDLAVWDCADPAELVYRIGSAPLAGRAWRGEWLSR